MRMILDSTDELVAMCVDTETDTAVMARVWHGQTSDGLDVVALIVRVGFISEDRAAVERATAQLFSAPPPVLVP
jgi:hypothetical protein